MTNAERANFILSLIPLNKHIGLTIESVEDGIYRCRVPLNTETGNHTNTMHAAVQFAVAEFMGGVVGVTALDPNDIPNVYGAVKSATIEYLRPVCSDITAEVRVDEAETRRIRNLISEGREARFTLEPDIRDAAGQRVATFRAEYVIRVRRS